MDVKKLKLSRRKKKLIYRLNNLCFGMHGHLTALLKDLHYFFYFKKHSKCEDAEVYLKIVFFHLEQIIVICRLIETLGEHPEVLAYKNNHIDYHRIKRTCKIDCRVAILDSLSTQLLILKEYLDIKEIAFEQNAIKIIDDCIESIKNQMRTLSENTTKKHTENAENIRF